jgi:hypothetical protein
MNRGAAVLTVHLPRPGDLGPDPEPLGERFAALLLRTPALRRDALPTTATVIAAETQAWLLEASVRAADEPELAIPA